MRLLLATLAVSVALPLAPAMADDFGVRLCSAVSCSDSRASSACSTSSSLSSRLSSWAPAEPKGGSSMAAMARLLHRVSSPRGVARVTTSPSTSTTVP